MSPGGWGSSFRIGTYVKLLTKRNVVSLLEGYHAPRMVELRHFILFFSRKKNTRKILKEYF